MKVSIRKITPDMAKTYVDTVEKNRVLNLGIVKHLTDQMRKGAWMDNGASVVFDAQGHLSDGQHRMNAVIQSGKTLNFVVVEGVDPAAYVTMDTGKSRDLGDTLSTADFDYARDVAAILRFVWEFDQGAFIPPRGKGPRLTNQQGLDRAVKHKKKWEATAKQSKAWASSFDGRLTKSCFGGIFHVLSRHDENKAYDFLETLASGAIGDARSPILHLLNLLTQWKIKKAEGKYRMTRRAQALAIAVAWNHWIKGEKIDRLRLRHDWEFPAIKGCNREPWI